MITAKPKFAEKISRVCQYLGLERPSHLDDQSLLKSDKCFCYLFTQLTLDVGLLSVEYRVHAFQQPADWHSALRLFEAVVCQSLEAVPYQIFLLAVLKDEVLVVIQMVLILCFIFIRLSVSGRLLQSREKAVK